MVLVGVYRHVRIYRLVVCNRTPYLHINTNTHLGKHATPTLCAKLRLNHAPITKIFTQSSVMICWGGTQVVRWGSPGFPKVMLCRFWKSVGLRPVASQTRTRTVPLNMVLPTNEQYHRDRAATRSLPHYKPT